MNILTSTDAHHHPVSASMDHKTDEKHGLLDNNVLEAQVPPVSGTMDKEPDEKVGLLLDNGALEAQSASRSRGWIDFAEEWNPGPCICCFLLWLLFLWSIEMDWIQIGLPSAEAPVPQVSCGPISTKTMVSGTVFETLPPVIKTLVGMTVTETIFKTVVVESTVVVGTAATETDTVETANKPVVVTVWDVKTEFTTTTIPAPSPKSTPIKVPLEAHIMSKCPDAKDCLKDLVVPAMEKIYDKVNFTLSYIGTYASPSQPYSMRPTRSRLIYLASSPTAA